jgi:acetyl esterase/lipase
VRYYRFDREAQKAEFLFTNRQALEGRPLQKMHPHVVKSRDGMDLMCYLTLPPGHDAGGKADRPVPMVLLVHGGPWGRDGWGFDPLHQLLSNRGYAVLSVNFRGSTGFGKKFLNAGNQEWAGKMHDDLIDAVNWAVAKKIADPSKIALMGGSYGGYATLVGLTFTPDVFACGVDIVGPSNILTLLSTIPPYWAPAVQMFKDRVGDFTSAEGKKFLTERSPLTHVAKIKRPLLIGQGANDPRVKQAESDQIVKAMTERSIPVTYVLFPDEGHGFARPANSLAFNAVAEAFLAKHLGGRYEPVGDAFDGSSLTVPQGAEGVPGLKEKMPKEGAPLQKGAAAPPTIKGKVIDSQKRAMAGSVVQLRDAKGRIQAEQRSDDKGSFAFEKVPAGKYVIEAKMAIPRMFGSTEVEVVAGPQKVEVVLKMK